MTVSFVSHISAILILSLSGKQACPVSYLEGNTKTVLPHTPLLPLQHLQKRDAAPSACWQHFCCTEWNSVSYICNSLQMMWGVRACLQPCTTLQGCATKTLSLCGEQPHWTPTGTEYRQPQLLAPHLHRLARSAEEVWQVQNCVPHQCKVQSVIHPSIRMRQAQTRQKNTQWNLCNMS